jgi:hypothetical protein
MSTTRNITLYNTRGGQPKVIESSATTWGDLRQEINEAGFDTSSLLATESVTRRDLNNTEAVLPEGEFTVFLRPRSTKSGAYSYREARAEISDLIETYGEQAKEHFCKSYDKNYTHMTTAELNTAIEEFSPLEDKQVAEEAAPSMNDNVDKAVDSLKEIKENENCTEDIADRIDDVIFTLTLGLKGDIDAVESPEAQEAAEAERLAKEAEEEAEKERLRMLQEQAEDLEDGFDD